VDDLEVTAEIFSAFDRYVVGTFTVKANMVISILRA